MSEWFLRLSELLNDSYRTLTVWQWMILGALPPLVVLLYFLKLKRQPLEVPQGFPPQSVENSHREEPGFAESD